VIKNRRIIGSKCHFSHEIYLGRIRGADDLDLLVVVYRKTGARKSHATQGARAETGDLVVKSIRVIDIRRIHANMRDTGDFGARRLIAGESNKANG
jgi:hypothetical protein